MLLDVGMATEMGGDDQENMIGLFRSFAKMDGRTCGDWVLKFSGVDSSSFCVEACGTINLLGRIGA